jgi:hypothetical protein
MRSSSRCCLKALKYARRQDLPEKMDALLAEAPVLEVLDVALILAYIDRGSVAVSPDVIREVLRRLVPDREEEIMGHLTQPYFAKGLAEGRFEGLAEGRAKGLVEGRAEGEAIALVRLLEKRFGVLPAALRQRCLARTWGPSRHGSGKQSMGPISSRFSNHPKIANTVGLIFTQHRAAISDVSDPGYPPISNLTGA